MNNANLKCKRLDIDVQMKHSIPCTLHSSRTLCSPTVASTSLSGITSTGGAGVFLVSNFGLAVDRITFIVRHLLELKVLPHFLLNLKWLQKIN